MNKKILLASPVIVLAMLAGCDRDGTTDTSDTTNTSTRDTTRQPADTTHREPDNTGVNARDRDSSPATQPTAGQQSQSRSDVDLAAEIRRKVTDTQMSINAQNAKIIVNGGKVTLRGPVKTQDEKDTIARFAAEVVGAGNVDNQLEVETN